VLLLRPETDVLLDPGDEHGEIVPLGAGGEDLAIIIMPADSPENANGTGNTVLRAVNGPDGRDRSRNN
jgi:hypothetical protein